MCLWSGDGGYKCLDATLSLASRSSVASWKSTVTWLSLFAVLKEHTDVATEDCAWPSSLVTADTFRESEKERLAAES